MDATAALRAILARLDGRWDEPALAAFGPLSRDRLLDVREIAARALGEKAAPAPAPARIDFTRPLAERAARLRAALAPPDFGTREWVVASRDGSLVLVNPRSGSAALLAAISADGGNARRFRSSEAASAEAVNAAAEMRARGAAPGPLGATTLRRALTLAAEAAEARLETFRAQAATSQ